MTIEKVRTRAALNGSVAQRLGRRDVPAVLWHALATAARDLGAEALEAWAHRRHLRRALGLLRAAAARPDPRGEYVDAAGLARAIAAMDDIAGDLRLTAQNPHMPGEVRVAAIAACEAVDAVVAEGRAVIGRMVAA